jgi:hypothetical protein
MGEHKLPRMPKYMPAVLEKSAQLPMRPGTVTVIEVQHEPHCPMLNGGNTCNCEFTLGDAGEVQ